METKPEPPYTVKEVAKVLGVSVQTVRRVFKDVRGVFTLPAISGKPGKRAYTELRIPRHVYRRVLQEWARQ